jgi:hypothetical protein
VWERLCINKGTTKLTSRVQTLKHKSSSFSWNLLLFPAKALLAEMCVTCNPPDHPDSIMDPPADSHSGQLHPKGIRSSILLCIFFVEHGLTDSNNCAWILNTHHGITWSRSICFHLTRALQHAKRQGPPHHWAVPTCVVRPCMQSLPNAYKSVLKSNKVVQIE